MKPAEQRDLLALALVAVLAYRVGRYTSVQGMTSVMAGRPGSILGRTRLWMQERNAPRKEDDEQARFMVVPAQEQGSGAAPPGPHGSAAPGQYL